MFAAKKHKTPAFSLRFSPNDKLITKNAAGGIRTRDFCSRLGCSDIPRPKNLHFGLFKKLGNRTALHHLGHVFVQVFVQVFAPICAHARPLKT